MEDNSVPFVAFESTISRLEAANKRLWIVCIILISILLITNVCWVAYENQFIDEVSVEQDIETGEGDAIVNGIGDLTYGEGKAKGY